MLEDKKLESYMFWAKLLWDLQTPEEKAQTVRKQSISFVYGNVTLHNPDVTREMVEEVYDRLHGKEEAE